MLFIEYPKCSTCKKAKAWLDLKRIKYEDRNIVEENPNQEELKKWILESGYPIKKFFNTSGMLYRELELSKKLETLSFEEQLKLLSSNGMLVKRPLLIHQNHILVGFKEVEWEQFFS